MSPWQGLFVRLVEALARIQSSLSHQIDEIMGDLPDRRLAVALHRDPLQLSPPSPSKQSFLNEDL